VSHPKAVVDGTVMYLSASQLKTHERCGRLWYAEKILGLRSEETGAQNTGTRVHKELEDYFKGGPPPAHPSALKALGDPRIPRPRADLLVEQWLENPKMYLETVEFRGKPDLVVPPGDDGIVRIFDWKTTSKAAYMKTEADIPRDVQLGLYAQWAYARWPEANGVCAYLVYLFTTVVKGRYEIVEAAIGPEDVAAVWDAAVARCLLMLEDSKAPSFEAVTGAYTDEACGAYGGCPMFGRCHSIAAIIDRVTEEDDATT
jgi:RecB family exonuclease